MSEAAISNAKHEESAASDMKLGDAVAERKGFEPLWLLTKRFSRLFGYSEVKVS